MYFSILGQRSLSETFATLSSELLLEVVSLHVLSSVCNYTNLLKQNVSLCV